MVTFTQPPEEFDGGDSQTWKPKVDGPTQVLGTVTDRKEVTREDGSTVEIINLKDDRDQLWTVWVSPTQLRKCVRKDNPQPGDTWGCQYEGSKSLGQGRSVDLYASYHTARGGAAAPQIDISSGPADTNWPVIDGEPF